MQPNFLVLRLPTIDLRCLHGHRSDCNPDRCSAQTGGSEPQNPGLLRLRLACIPNRWGSCTRPTILVACLLGLAPSSLQCPVPQCSYSCSTALNCRFCLVQAPIRGSGRQVQIRIRHTYPIPLTEWILRRSKHALDLCVCFTAGWDGHAVGT